MVGKTPKKSSKKSAAVTKKKAAKRGSAKAAKTSKRKYKPLPQKAGQPTLLSGGNPQIPKGYGDAPVQAYIAAMPGWKSDLGRRLDALIVRTVPNVAKAVKWNSPLYGIEGQGWFIGVHVFTKTTSSTKLSLPPGSSKRAKCLARKCECEARCSGRLTSS